MSLIRFAAPPNKLRRFGFATGRIALVASLSGAVIFALTSSFALASPSRALPHSASIEAVFKGQEGAYACAVSLRDGRGFSFRDSAPVKPASIQKLLTTAAAFRRFGTEARFGTEVYVERVAGQEDVSLYLRGLGDPVLTTESMWMLARAVRAHGLGRIREIFYDDSLFDGAKRRGGQRAYMGGASALSINFNAFAVTACPNPFGGVAKITVEPFEAGVRATGTVQSVGNGGSSISVDERGSEESASYAVSGRLSATGGCKSVYRSAPNPAEVAAELFRSQLSYLGMKVPPAAERGVVPKSARLLEVGLSKPLHEVAWGMNHWSTNVIAEQLMMSLGAPANQDSPLEIPLGRRIAREDAITALNSFATRFYGNKSGIDLQDGSGLSHGNKAPAALFCALLKSVAEDPAMIAEFEHSLPASGRSGTLRERGFGLPQAMVRAKTGSLDGVSSLAGYLVSRHGTKYAFTVIVNSSRSKEDAVQLEDRFVRALYNDFDS